MVWGVKIEVRGSMGKESGKVPQDAEGHYVLSVLLYFVFLRWEAIRRILRQAWDKFFQQKERAKAKDGWG